MDKNVLQNVGKVERRGNGAADATLFKMLHVLGNVDAAVQCFKLLYKVSPSEYLSSFPKLQQALDMYASIVAAKSPLNVCHTTEKWTEHEDILADMLNSAETETEDEFQRDPVFAISLKRLKELTEDIVNTEMGPEKILPRSVLTFVSHVTRVDSAGSS